MAQIISPSLLCNQLLGEKDFLIIQDVDGVCVPLVKDPLKRKIDIEDIEAVRKLKGEFSVLTNGEHEGRRGLNFLIEQTYSNSNIPYNKNKYLPGLAAGGIEYQNRFGEAIYPGVTKRELDNDNSLSTSLLLP